MNPGYLSYLLICILCILLASGWKDILFRGFSRTSILLFFVGWIPLSWITVNVAGLHVRLSALFLLLLAVLCTWVLEGTFAKVHVWCAGLLLGSFDFLMRELNGWSMVLQHVGHIVNASVILALLTVVLGRNAVWQFIAVTVGLLSSEFVHIWLQRLVDPNRAAGGAIFSDRWWLTICAARGMSVALEYSCRHTAASVKQWMNSRKGWGE